MRNSPTDRATRAMRIALSVVFVFVLAFFAVTSFILPRPEFSESEKRVLAKKPALTADALFSGSYTRDLESWYTDGFPGRETLLGVNRSVTALYYIGGGGSDVLLPGGSAVDLGEGESLLDPAPPTTSDTTATGSVSTTTDSSSASTATSSSSESSSESSSGSSSTVSAPDYPDDSDIEAVEQGEIIMTADSAMETFYISKSNLEKYGKLIEKIQDALPETQVYSLFAPTAVEFYSPDDYHSGSQSQKKAEEIVYGCLSKAKAVDIWQAMYDKRGEYIYFRTDHHWTQRGAYYAYSVFCRTAGLEPVPMTDFTTGRLENFVGSMYNFTKKYAQSDRLKQNPDYVEYFVPKTECTATVFEDSSLTGGYKIPVVNPNLTDKTSNKYLTFISGDNPITRITTSVKNGRKILMTKESYGNAFAPFLVNHYEEIYVVDPRTFNGDGKPSFNLPSFVKKHGINDILIINYSFAATNKAIINGLSRMIG